MSVRGERGLKSPGERSTSSRGSVPLIDLVSLRSAKRHLDLSEESFAEVPRTAEKKSA